LTQSKASVLAYAEPVEGITIDEMFAEADKAGCRNHCQGTNAKTGRRMEFRDFVEWRFEGDKIAERWATVTALIEIKLVLEGTSPNLIERKLQFPPTESDFPPQQRSAHGETRAHSGQ
jgi:hypothetical protein